MKKIADLSNEEMVALGERLERMLPPDCVYTMIIGDEQNHHGTFSNVNIYELPDMLRAAADLIEERLIQSN